jgi:Flp pilus assembly pilin Flp
MRLFTTQRAQRKGAALVEYGILVGLIAVVAIGTVGGLGFRIQDVFGDASTRVDANMLVATDADGGNGAAPDGGNQGGGGQGGGGQGTGTPVAPPAFVADPNALAVWRFTVAQDPSDARFTGATTFISPIPYGTIGSHPDVPVSGGLPVSAAHAIFMESINLFQIAIPVANWTPAQLAAAQTGTLECDFGTYAMYPTADSGPGGVTRMWSFWSANGYTQPHGAALGGTYTCQLIP